MNSDEIRMIRKRFLCLRCNKKQSKLVGVYDTISKCEICDSLMKEVSEEQFKEKTREEVNQNYRIVFNEQNRGEYHNRFDTNDTSKSNVDGKTNKKFKKETPNRRSENIRNERNVNQQQKRQEQSNHQNMNREYSQNNQYRNNSYTQNDGNLFSNFFPGIFNANSNQRNQNVFGNIFPNTNSQSRQRDNNFFGDFFSDFGINFPFGESPFMGRINRHTFNDEIFDPAFESFGSTFNNFFQDNFASNFRSNYRSPESFFDIFTNIRTTNEEPREQANKGTSKEVLKSLKRFKMNDKFCKKNEKGEMEVPNCCICLSDISKGEETLLLPCGHLFHSSCSLPWLKKNNTCPVCRFDLPSDQN